MIRKGQALGITRNNLHGQAWLFGSYSALHRRAKCCTFETRTAFQPQMQHCPVPINASQGPVYLSLYGTGFRHRSASQNGAPSAGCHIQNQFLSAAIYAGPQGRIPGLDQLNLLLPQTPGAGETDLVCTFSLSTQVLSETAFSPPVKIKIQ